MEDAEFTTAEKQLAPGDKMMIYSDGVTESQNRRGEFFGRKRLREVAQAHAGDSCLDLHEAVQSAIAAFTEGAPQADDVTVVVVEYRP
jgi:sigma-B regulation protein RsbU (phosphoserine phosphatase)